MMGEQQLHRIYKITTHASGNKHFRVCKKLGKNFRDPTPTAKLRENKAHEKISGNMILQSLSIISAIQLIAAILTYKTTQLQQWRSKSQVIANRKCMPSLQLAISAKVQDEVGSTVLLARVAIKNARCVFESIVSSRVITV